MIKDKILVEARGMMLAAPAALRTNRRLRRPPARFSRSWVWP